VGVQYMCHGASELPFLLVVEDARLPR
jgi:hypothetical protein